MVEREEKKPVKEKHVEKKGKRIRTGRKHESPKIYKFYEVKGNKAVRIGGFCPRCGPGVGLAKHQNRSYCGRCGYTLFEK
jgi:small subunit ribosomal protein S27Ae